MQRSKLIFPAIASASLAVLTAGAAAQGPIQSRPPLVLRSTVGGDLYQFYCAGCHGPTASGGTARPGQPTPPDLTALTRGNNGLFPRDRVRDAITFGPTAAQLPSHGAANMPAWGAVFRGLDANDASMEIRIENLVRYLASLQETAEGH